VGRFRKFVDAYVAGWRPAAGAGKHTHLNGGKGLAAAGGGYETGWDKAWESIIPTTLAAWNTGLACYAPYQVWTNTPAANAANCLLHLGRRLHTERSGVELRGWGSWHVYPWSVRRLQQWSTTHARTAARQRVRKTSVRVAKGTEFGQADPPKSGSSLQMSDRLSRTASIAPNYLLGSPCLGPCAAASRISGANCVSYRNVAYLGISSNREWNTTTRRAEA
jgi:hypothetical protein